MLHRVLHDLPAYLTTDPPLPPSNQLNSSDHPPKARESEPEAPPPLTPATLAAILTHLQANQITIPTARKLLALCAASGTSSLTSPSPSSEDAASVAPHQPTSTNHDNTPALRAITNLITTQNLRLHSLSDAEYVALAERIVSANGEMARKVRAEVAALDQQGDRTSNEVRELRGRGVSTKVKGKLMWFVGQMVREGPEERVQPGRAEGIIRGVLFGERE